LCISHIVPFGAAASPDLTNPPGVPGRHHGRRGRGEWLDRWGNAFTALVLIVIGALVLAGVI
jgi:hypothetical protein